MSTLDKEKLLQRVSGSYGDGLKNLGKIGKNRKKATVLTKVSAGQAAVISGDY